MKIRWSIVFLALFGVVAALAAAVLTASLSAQGIQAARTPEVTEVTVLVAALFLFAGSTKLAGMQMHVEHFARWGYPDWFRLVVGFVEVVGALMLLIPAWSFYGAAILMVDMIGAAITHLTHAENPAFPFVLLVFLAWIAYGRRPAGRVAPA